MSEPSFPPHRVRDIFMAALEAKDSETRTRILDRECGGDSRLRSEVESMLAQTPQLEGFLEKPAAAETETWREKKASERIGPYKLLQEIGEGGCGVVYMAEQETPVRRRVALKIIKLGMDTKSVIARFESERQALAIMDHPNIAKVLDAGATEAGRPYFVMELVRGVRITDYCDQHKLSTDDRLQLFVKVSQAIQHAHQKGIIHRDIKPSNILVTLHDGLPVPKIIDFGIAKAVDQRLTDKTLFTEFQSFIGTPAYMSPEQAEMSGLDVDTRSDIYSLGVLLYELLVGSTPFDGKTLRDVGLDECRRTIREVEPPKPSQRFSTLLDGDRKTIALQRHTESLELLHHMRGDLDWIVMKCLDKDRQRRYATANALAMDVQRYMDGDLVSARPPSTFYRLQKTWHRHRLAFSAVAAVAITLVVGVAVSTSLAIRASKAERESNVLRLAALVDRTRAVENAARARLNEYVADMNVANHSLDEGNFGRAWQLIDKHVPESDAEDLRGFEWRFLAHRSQGDEHLDYPLQGDAIGALAFSSDGVLLGVGMEKETKIWDLRTQSMVMALPKGAHSLAFIDGGRTLVSADSESITAWRSTTWTEEIVLPVQSSIMVMSRDGRLMATGAVHRRGRNSREEVRIWTTASWDEQRSVPGSFGAMALSLDGSLLATGSRQGISVWDTRTAELMRTLDDSADLLSPFSSRSAWLAFSPDARMIVAPRNDRANLLSIWDATSGRELGVLPQDPRQVHHRSTIAAASWTPDGTKLITGGWDHTIQIWDGARQEHVGALQGHRNEVWALAVDPTGETLASGGKDGELLLWAMNTPRKEHAIEGSWRPVAFNPASSRFAAINRNNRLTIFETASLSEIQTIELGDSESWRQREVAISEDLETLVLETSDRSVVEVRNLSSRSARMIRLGENRISRFTLSPDARYLIVGGRREPGLVWWDLEQPEEPVKTMEADRALFSRDGSTLATLSRHDGRQVQIWNVDGRDQRSEITLQSNLGSAAALSHDGRWLAIATDPGDANHAIRLWDTTSGDRLGLCRGHKQSIRAVAISPDGKTLASASDDNTLKLWNLTTQQELLSIQNLGLTVFSLIFSPDGQWLATGSNPFSSTGQLRLIHAPRR